MYCKSHTNYASTTQVPTAAARATLRFFYLTKIESGEAFAVFLCLALAHRARLPDGRRIRAWTHGTAKTDTAAAAKIAGIIWGDPMAARYCG